MVGLAATIARFFEVLFYLAFGLAKQWFRIGSSFYLRLSFIFVDALGLGMRTLVWNCRGAGSALTVRALKALIREENPDVVFIAESKTKSCRIERIRSSIGFVDKFCVDPIGKSGGLAIFWKAGVDLEIVYSDKNVIASLAYSNPLSSPWLFLLIYGPPHVNGRARFWKCLEDLVSAFASPWLVMGDFNCVNSNVDKRGGRYLGEASTRSFSNFVHGTGAIDLGFIGSRFTWSNKREGLANIKERLDKAVCNQEWLCLFPKAGVKHLVAPSSDHAPIILDTHMDQSVRARPFRFEAMWTRDDSSAGIVEKAWQGVVEGSQCFKLARKIQQTRIDLQVWNRNHAKMIEIRTMLNCLDCYGKWSGQIISVEKSGIFSSKGVHPEFLRQVKNQLGIKKLRQGTKYLGVPLFLSNNKAKDFAYVKEKVKARLASWKCKSLSWAVAGTLELIVGMSNLWDSILVWEDPWIPDKSGFIPSPRDQEDNSCLVVSQLLNSSGSGWNDILLNDLFDHESIAAIKNIPIWSFGMGDRWTWTKSENGKFSVNSCYRLISDGDNSASSVSLTRKIWKANIHERLKMHLWRIAFNLLPTRDKLREFSPSSESSCPLCNDETESAMHLFTHCHIARACWFGSRWNIRIDSWNVQSLAHLIEFLVEPPPSLQLDKEQRNEFLLFGALVLDLIWMWRNKAINENSLPMEDQIIRSIKKLFLEHWRPKVPVTISGLARNSARWRCPSQDISDQFWRLGMVDDACCCCGSMASLSRVKEA
nr:putative ribonuclease h protein [Quercus suber]